MTTGKRRVLIGLGAVFGIVVIAAAVLYATINQSRAKQYISAAVSKATGRQLRINGDLKFDLGWISRVNANQIQFANADWSKQAQMAEIEDFDVQIDLWQLLTKFRLVLPTVTISRPKLVLEKNSGGAANWEFPVAPSGPQKRTEVPIIEKMIIKDGLVSFDNRQTNTQIELKVSEAEGAGFLQQPVKLRAQGTYQKLPLTITLDGGSYENLRNSKQPYPLRIDLGAGKLKAKIEGNLIEPLAMKGEDVTLDIQGDDMSKLYPLIHLVFPATPPYRLKGHLKHEGDVWSFSEFSGRVGNSDLGGSIKVDTAPKRPFMKADLVSNVLDFDDLAGFVGGNPGSAPEKNGSEEQKQRAVAEKNSDRIFPDQQFNLERLRTMDADVQLRAKKIIAPKLPIDDLNAKLTLNNGVMSFTPARFGVADGRVELFSTFDGSQRPSKVKIDARLRKLDLRRFLAKNSMGQKALGPIGGRIMLTGTGESFRDLMATSSGSSFFTMSGGEISDLVTQLAGLDVAHTVSVMVSGDKPIPIRCAMLDFQGENGQMAVQNLVFDTPTSVISGGGNIDLRDEKVNIVILPAPKHFSPLSLRSYIRVSGGFKNISVFPDPIKTGTDSLFKKIVNVLTLLVTSPFQPRDFGQGEDVDCAAMFAKLRKQDPQGLVLKDVQKPNPPATTEK
jgi:AsmA family protein